MWKRDEAVKPTGPASPATPATSPTPSTANVTIIVRRFMAFLLGMISQA